MESVYNKLNCATQVLRSPASHTRKKIINVFLGNVKASRALLFMARWLQRRILTHWCAEEDLLGSAELEEVACDDILVLIGPAGTGKTIVERSRGSH